MKKLFDSFDLSQFFDKKWTMRNLVVVDSHSFFFINMKTKGKCNYTISPYVVPIVRKKKIDSRAAQLLFYPRS